MIEEKRRKKYIYISSLLFITITFGDRPVLMALKRSKVERKETVYHSFSSLKEKKNTEYFDK
jgi:hypothetical protein